MRLAAPTDFEILEALSDGKRNTAANLAKMLEKDRSYLNTRLPILADYDLVEKVGPAQNSGLYVISENGVEVIEFVDQHSGPPEEIDVEAILE